MPDWSTAVACGNKVRWFGERPTPAKQEPINVRRPKDHPDDRRAVRVWRELMARGGWRC